MPFDKVSGKVLVRVLQEYYDCLERHIGPTYTASGCVVGGPILMLCAHCRSPIDRPPEWPTWGYRKPLG